jgi:creatinine amidohydrolase
MTLAERSVPEAMAERSRVKFGGDVAFGWSSDDLTAGGVIGDPTLASAERGAELWAGMVRSAGDALAEVATFAFPRRA